MCIRDRYTSSKKNLNYKSENVIIGPGSKELMFLLHIIFDGEIILPAQAGFLMHLRRYLEEIKLRFYKQKQKIIGSQQQKKLRNLF